VREGLEERWLWTPAQTFKIGIFSLGERALIGLLGLPLDAASFFVLPLHLQSSLTIAFGERGFSWSGDDTLLGV
jgi:hypothetical protein